MCGRLLCDSHCLAISDLSAELLFTILLNCLVSLVKASCKKKKPKNFQLLSKHILIKSFLFSFKQISLRNAPDNETEHT